MTAAHVARAGAVAVILGALTVGAPAKTEAPRFRDINDMSRVLTDQAQKPNYRNNVTIKRQFRTPRHHVRPRREIRPVPPAKLSAGIVRSKTGATARVHPSAAANFQCLVDHLDNIGFKIKFMGGYGSRPNNYSLHPSGRALDINQTARNRWVGGRFPSNINAIARGCGLLHGAEWRNADGAHFQMADGRIRLWPIAKVQDAISAAVAPPINQELARSMEEFNPATILAERDAKDYIILTAKPGFTMTKQGINYSIDQLHPAFAIRLAAALREARAQGLNVGVFSAYRRPGLGVGGFGDKHASLHAYGLAVDLYGLAHAGSPHWHRWHAIATRHKLVNPYVGTRAARWEFNHYQATGITMIARHNPLRKTITKAGPIDVKTMWTVASRFLDKPVHIIKAVHRAPRKRHVVRRKPIALPPEQNYVAAYN